MKKSTLVMLSVIYSLSATTGVAAGTGDIGSGGVKPQATSPVSYNELFRVYSTDPDYLTVPYNSIYSNDLIILGRIENAMWEGRLTPSLGINLTETWLKPRLEATKRVVAAGENLNIPPVGHREAKEFLERLESVERNIQAYSKKIEKPRSKVPNIEEQLRLVIANVKKQTLQEFTQVLVHQRSFVGRTYSDDDYRDLKQRGEAERNAYLQKRNMELEAMRASGAASISIRRFYDETMANAANMRVTEDNLPKKQTYYQGEHVTVQPKTMSSQDVTQLLIQNLISEDGTGLVDKIIAVKYGINPDAVSASERHAMLNIYKNLVIPMLQVALTADNYDNFRKVYGDYKDLTHLNSFHVDYDSPNNKKVVDKQMKAISAELAMNPQIITTILTEPLLIAATVLNDNSMDFRRHAKVEMTPELAEFRKNNPKTLELLSQIIVTAQTWNVTERNLGSKGLGLEFNDLLNARRTNPKTDAALNLKNNPKLDKDYSSLPAICEGLF